MQPIYKVRKTIVLQTLAEKGLEHTGLNFGGGKPLDVMYDIAKLPSDEFGMLHISAVMNVLQKHHTGKLLGGANRGLRQAAEIIKLEKVAVK